MKHLSLIILTACLVALTGISSANASPTYVQSCFETEKEAIRHQSYYQYRDVDHSEASQKDERATALVMRGNVKLSELEAILGKPRIEVDEISNIAKHEWIVSFMGSPNSGSVSYDSSRGYCVSTRAAGFGMVSFTMEIEGFDKTGGTVNRHEFYY